MSKKFNLLHHTFEVLSIPNISKPKPEFNGRIKEVNNCMKEVELYGNTNKMQRQDSSNALKEYSSRIRWKKQNAKILDVGCGDGGVTVQVLKPYLPKNFEKLIGFDISNDMVAHANQYYKDDKTEFRVMDIEGDITQYLGEFDHVFSFYTLHWIQNQKKALSNIYSMLARGGDCLLMFICYQPAFNTYRVMANSPTWSQYMLDVENYISPYQDSQEPEEELRNLMLQCGFKNVGVKCEIKYFIYEDIAAMKNALQAVNPFVHRLPPALSQRFMEDYIAELLQSDGFSMISNEDRGSQKIKCCYKLLFAYASK